MVFHPKDDEDDEGQEDKEGTEEENEADDKDDSGWGITVLLMEVAQKTATPIQQLYDFSCTEFFYYASYIIDEMNKKLAEIKKLKRSPK